MITFSGFCRGRTAIFVKWTFYFALLNVAQTHLVKLPANETESSQSNIKSGSNTETSPKSEVLYRLRRETNGRTTNSSSSDNLIWQEWSACTATTCGAIGQQNRTTICFTNENQTCNSGLTQIRNCEVPCSELSGSGNYFVNDSWTEWEPWAPCSVSCGKGMTLRSRNCSNDETGGCNGHHEERKPCKAAIICPYWSAWSSWSKCSNSCGINAFRTRARECVTATRGASGSRGDIYIAVDNQNTKVPCPGGSSQASEVGKCLSPSRCIGWSDWGTWGSCSVDCGKGISSSRRTCNGNSTGACIGHFVRRQTCYTSPCWSSWSSWGGCSKTCGTGEGFRTRVRSCRFFTYSQRTRRRCDGRRAEKMPCRSKSQICHEWGQWSPYSDCSRSCDGGFMVRYRTCPTESCLGSNVDHTSCNYHPCPYLTTWTSFSCCSASCGEGGERTRSRACRHGTHGGPGCEGDLVERVPCFLRHCHIAPPSVFSTFKCGATTAVAQTRSKFSILRIFGGTDAVITSWPWQASWQVRGCLSCTWRHFCGATLIAPKWVLTAGHCTEESVYRVNRDDPGENWSVMLGMQQLNRDGTRHFVRRVFVHPDYHYSNITVADMSLLKLRKAAIFTERIRPICLPQTITPQVGQQCSITGWGYMGPEKAVGARQPVELQQAYVPIYDFNKCLQLDEEYLTSLDAVNHMCAGNATTAATDSCTGDSGGPLACRRQSGLWYLTGVTSFGFKACGTPNHVGIYTPLTSFEGWLRDKIEKFSLDDC